MDLQYGATEMDIGGRASEQLMVIRSGVHERYKPAIYRTYKVDLGYCYTTPFQAFTLVPC